MGVKTVRRLVILIVTVLVTGLVDLLHPEISSLEDGSSQCSLALLRQRKTAISKRRQRLYQEHLEVAPDDQDAQLKYADVLLKGVKNLGRQDLAAQIYDKLLARSPGRADIRRRLAELKLEMGQLSDGPAASGRSS